MDPAGSAPLPLDHTDLIGLELWFRMSSQPRGGDFAAAAAQRLTAGTLSPRNAARVVADWPQYYTGIQPTETGANVVTMPNRDILPIFTTPENAEVFTSFYRAAGILEGEWQTVPLPHKWTHSAFLQAQRHHEDGAWIDPKPGEEPGGLPVPQAMLEDALERIDEQLKPRVPGFVWEE